MRAFRRAGLFLKSRASALFRLPRAPHGMAHACVCAALLLFAWTMPGARYESKAGASVVAPSEDETDEALRRAAQSALGGREGTIIALDAQTGRVRAIVNPRLAYEETFAPGSTIKPFTLLAALRTGVLNAESHVACRQPFKHEDFKINCAHPPSKTAFAPAQALAFSCNYFFGRAGERLDAGALTRTLDAFGFGARTGGGSEREASGRVPSRERWRVPDALGESEQLLVTPAQLVAAYASLFNGGRLFAPLPAPAENFRPRQRAQLEIEPGHRALLVEGMRGAVAYGTAARADLNTLNAYVFGKTGTSTPPGDFRTQGWFVGFDAERAAGAGSSSGDGVTPESIGLAVLVLLKRGHGVDAAELARPVFQAHARIEEARRAAAVESAKQADEAERDAAAEAGAFEEERPGASPGARASRVVRVHLSRADRTLALPLDEYVFGVLAAEGSVETEPEALKAQAVVSRTYALKNLRRHAREGFDLCSSTHCQRYVAVGDGSARPEFYELLRRVIQKTTGEVLRDREGRLAESYFSASCGGATANLKTLWGTASAPSHLRGVRDDFCAGTAYQSWQDVIRSGELLKALRADKRSDVGAHLSDVRVLRRDASGRAEMVALEGERRRILRGWDFKLIVGRTLGWNILKSSRFEVTRVGGNFIFRGSGFGHGLGLCQTGAHVMAHRGASYRQIINQFFPGTTVGTHEKRSAGLEQADASPPEEPSAELQSHDARRENYARRESRDARQATFKNALFHLGSAIQVAAFHLGSTVKSAHLSDFASSTTHFKRAAPSSPGEVLTASAPRLTMSSEHFRVSYPSRVERREVESMLRTLEGARRDVLGRIERAGLNTAGLGTAELYLHETTGDFTASTGQPSWVAASTKGRRIDSQPPAVLRRRGVLSTTLRHEFVHVALETLGRGRAPLWLVEGLAAHVAGEGALLARSGAGKKLSVEELGRGLVRANSAQEMSALYAAALSEVLTLIRREGEAAAWRRALRG
jgi:stage II sporulation protein D